MSYLVNPFPNKPWFLRVYSTRLLKTLWEKEKLLRAPAIDRQRRQMRKFLTNGSKIETLANLLATRNIYKRFLIDLK